MAFALTYFLNSPVNGGLIDSPARGLGPGGLGFALPFRFPTLGQSLLKEQTVGFRQTINPLENFLNGSFAHKSPPTPAATHHVAHRSQAIVTFSPFMGEYIRGRAFAPESPSPALCRHVIVPAHR
ncbi:MAG: hypothetical protein JWN51_103 [Phycisphaerales bacterium]|nr:hypothetical protein [Phycisphaerales bacterium]